MPVSPEGAGTAQRQGPGMARATMMRNPRNMYATTKRTEIGLPRGAAHGGHQGLHPGEGGGAAGRWEDVRGHLHVL